MPIRARLMLGFGLLCLTLVVAPLTMYMVHSSRTLQAARLKQVGITPSKALLRMVQLLQQHRGLSAAVLGGYVPVEAQRAAKQTETDKAITTFDAIVTSEIRDAAFVVDWRRAHEAWQRLANGVSSHSMSWQDSFVAHTALIGDNLKLLDLMLDHFGLSYDPTGQDYHLTMALLVHMPTLTEFLGQARVRGTVLLAQKRITLADRLVLISLIDGVERQYEHVEREMEKAIALNPKMKVELGDFVLVSRALGQKATDLARNQVVAAEKLRYSPDDYFAVFTRAIDGQFTLLEKATVDLEGRLQARIVTLRSGQTTMIGFIVLMIALAGCLGTVIVRAIKSDIVALQQGEEAQRRYAGELEATVERLKQAQAEVRELNRQLTVRAERIAVINRLITMISSSLDIGAVYNAFAVELRKMIAYTRMGIVVAEVGGKRLRIFQSTGDRDSEAVAGKVWSNGEETGIHWVMTQRQPHIEPDLAEARLFAEDDVIYAEGIRSTIRLPMIAKGETVGALFVDDVEPGRYADRDLELLMPLAEQLAIAIENARLYEAEKTARTALQETQATLIEAERLRAMGQMASGVAHDFNNALMGVLGQTQLMRLTLEQGPVADTLRGMEGHAGLLRCLARQEQAILDAAETIRKIREATRPRNQEAFRPVALSEIAEQILAISRPRWKDQAEAAGVQMTVRTAFADAPPVLGNAAELREALTNLLFNALDAMPHGGAITIAVRQVTGDFVDLSVTDTGVGISQEVQAHLFEPFYTTKGMRGTGLGLSMVHGIVSRHQGVISVQSAEGQGTTMTLRLPVAQATAEVILPPAVPLSLPGPLTLLVIDDEPLLAETLADLLRLMGHEAEVAISGEAGLARLQTGRFDCLVTDLGMPGMSGWEVARASRARHPDLPVILVTGWGDGLDRAQIEECGVDAVVAKPYTLHALLDGLSLAWARVHDGRGSG